MRLTKPMAHPPVNQAAGPQPVLRVTDAMSLIVGTVIGAGIFRTPPLVASNAGSEGEVFFAWGLGGALSLIGALCYAELATAFPHAGGDYHFLSRAYGQRLAFLFAWARLAVIQTGSISLLAFIAGDYAARLSVGPASPALYAACVVVVLTGLNVAGIRPGSLAQTVLTGGVVVGLLIVVGTGLAVAGAGGPPLDAPPAPMNESSAFGLSMVFVLLTYGGWSEAAYVSAEVEPPGRNMVRALVGSILVVTTLYLLVNWAYLRGLGHAGLATSTAVAVDLVERATGGVGAQLVSALIVLAAITSANGTIFTGARTAYALGRDFPPFAILGRWTSETRTPVNALLIQGGIALALVGLGAWTRRGFETMVEYTAPVFWLFLLLTGVSVFILRRTVPSARPFPVPLYPLTPLLFCATSGYLLFASLAYTGIGSLVGMLVLGIGGLVLAAFSGWREVQPGAAD